MAEIGAERLVEALWNLAQVTPAEWPAALVDGGLRLSGAHRGCLLLVQADLAPSPAQNEPEVMQVSAARDAAGREIPADFVQAHRPALARLLEGDKEQPEFGLPVPSGSAMILPLQSGPRLHGALILELLPGSSPEEAARPLLALYTGQAALLFERDRQDAALAEAYEKIGEYISLVTHQLMVPMTSISGYTDLILRGMVGPLNERQEEFLTKVKRNVDRMVVLVENLADINRLERGRMRLVIAGFDLAELVQAVFDRHQAHFETRRQSAGLEHPGGSVRVLADRAASEQILDELIKNAHLYTPEGGNISVRLSVSSGRAAVTVADSGIGLSEEEQAKLFTPFFRSEDPRVREHVGWGLGLALARLLAEAQRGSLCFESEIGKGSAFTLHLLIA